MFFAKPLQRSNLCASHRQRRWLTHGELKEPLVRLFAAMVSGWKRGSVEPEEESA